MKTQVELFEITEVREETHEQSAEAQQLSESLGLKGQSSLTSYNTTTEKMETVTAQRFPYRLITDEELFVYSQLCPAREDVHRYDSAPIPLEVLKTLAYAKSLDDKRLAYLEVWSASSAAVKDPILVGKSGSWSDDKTYILARWGEELLPLSVLLPDALKIWYAKRMDALNKIKLDVENALRLPLPMGVPGIRQRRIPTLDGLND